MFDGISRGSGRSKSTSTGVWPHCDEPSRSMEPRGPDDRRRRPSGSVPYALTRSVRSDGGRGACQECHLGHLGLSDGSSERGSWNRSPTQRIQSTFRAVRASCDCVGAGSCRPRGRYCSGCRSPRFQQGVQDAHRSDAYRVPRCRVAPVGSATTAQLHEAATVIIHRLQVAGRNGVQATVSGNAIIVTATSDLSKLRSMFPAVLTRGSSLAPSGDLCGACIQSTKLGRQPGIATDPVGLPSGVSARCKQPASEHEHRSTAKQRCTMAWTGELPVNAFNRGHRVADGPPTHWRQCRLRR